MEAFAFIYQIDNLKQMQSFSFHIQQIIIQCHIIYFVVLSPYSLSTKKLIQSINILLIRYQLIQIKLSFISFLYNYNQYSNQDYNSEQFQTEIANFLYKDYIRVRR
ncbi:unnamed protein product (macronuclear) [Paramecium tetraurelia]|uniref:Transmembrane protein n=1 Tax=Paramecium tetraurelia TaxID=5888 RepID=A0CIY7_PARTE|nr:uncharacterized protein GSPATT00007889001 [Paramecium tetraurelia]CAK70754.1 unnamed protein product [Paramecium tetraurelia]|eukprot:XP_001438151.1 hypothetical protein (macronuclear) [Paramecium tetraurelia strain d4-2]